MSLYDVLKTGYSNDKNKQAKFGEKHGYVLDKNLTTNSHQVYYNPTENKLLYNGNGTKNNLQNFFKDWKTNAYIAVGQGKNAPRYQQEKNALEKARKKYNPAETIITGHSQFGFIAPRIASQKHGDKVITYNKASVGGKVYDNEKHYRIDKDIISTPTLMDGRNTKTYSTKPITFFQNPLQRLLESHNLSSIKDKNISVI
jgi:hypothetical protein